MKEVEEDKLGASLPCKLESAPTTYEETDAALQAATLKGTTVLLPASSAGLASFAGRLP